MSPFSPFKILAFLTACFGMLAMISWVFPKDGIPVGDHASIRFPDLASVFSRNEEEADITNIVAMEVEDDTSMIAETPQVDVSKIHGLVKLDSGVVITAPMEMRDPAALNTFFAALQTCGSEGNSVRIMHYGDSQIEVDRITGYIRGRLQAHFGGSGPGFLNIMPVAEGMAFRMTRSDGWERYTTFTSRDQRVPYRSYGPAAAFSRYLPIPDSTFKPVEQHSAWLKLENTRKAGSRVANFTSAKLYYGNSHASVQVHVLADGAVVLTDSLALNGTMHTLDVPLAQAPSTLEFAFSGYDSPDLYGISLEGAPGVIVDNLALRGSSGDFFSGMDLTQLRTFYEHVGVDLFILQFGGNTIPYLKDEAHAQSYARSIAAQIRTLKKMQPNACLVFVGPSDMSIKDGMHYVTHPMLEPLNKALHDAVLDSGAAYFDMYKAMGGKNSMVAWVDAGLAGADYIHFSPEGARKIGVLFYHALMQEYNNYIIRNSGQ